MRVGGGVGGYIITVRVLYSNLLILPGSNQAFFQASTGKIFSVKNKKNQIHLKFVLICTELCMYTHV